MPKGHMRNFFISIRFHLTWLVLLAVMPAVGLLMFSGQALREAETQRAIADANHIAETLSVRQEAITNETRQLLATLAVIPDVRFARAGCQPLLAESLANAPSLTNLGVADLNGEVVCSAVQLSDGVNISDRFYFQRALSTNGFSVGDVQIGRVTGEPAVNFGYPIHEGEVISGVVYAAVDLGWFSQFAGGVDIPPGTEITILDQHGGLVGSNFEIDSDASMVTLVEKLKSANNVLVFPSPNDGVNRYYIGHSISESPGGSAYLLVGFPYDQFFAKSNITTRNTLIAMLGATLLAIGIAWVFGEFAFTRRLIRMLDVARRIASGDLSARSEIRVGKSEVSQLVMAVDEMAENLQERARVNEERAKLLDSSHDAIMMRDRNGIIRTWNKGAEALFGFSEEEAVGKFLPDLLKTSYPDSLDEIEWRCITEKYWEGELTHIRKNGEKVVVASRWTSLLDSHGRVYAILESHTDIGGLKQAEIDRIGREVAEQASRSKSEFLSRMSHELRTPLNAILGFSQLLEMDELAEDQSESVGQILNSGRHLLGLINEVLDIARIESGRLSLNFEPIKVEDAIMEAFNIIRPLADARGLKMTMKLPSSSDVFIMADRQRFKQVLLNLLSNAVKYNRPGGKIYIEGSLTVAGFLRLDVQDTGDGIPAVKMARLFQPFDRLDRTDEQQDGTGLGLALSRGLMEAMNGRLWAESVFGKGTVMRVELPLVTERLKENLMAEVDEHIREEKLSKGGVVLYVEDNLANVQLVEAIFSRLPVVHLLTAMQGQMAMDLARVHKPDLILLDVHLPDMNGADVLRWLKSRPDTRRIPVVVISADALPAQVDKMMTLGSRKYLTKPIVVREFLDVMNEMLLDA